MTATERPPILFQRIRGTPEDRKLVAQQIQEMVATHQAFDFTKRIVRPDGEIRTIRWVGGLAVGDDAHARFVGTGMDVTEQ